MSKPSWLDQLKMLIRENDVPYFDDAELTFHYERNARDLEATAYTCLLIKAENSGLSVSGLSTADTAEYFRRLASHYRPNNSGTLKGVF